VPAFLSSPISVAAGGAAQAKGSGAGQRDFVISAVAASVPIYAGGRITNTIESNRALVRASEADECTRALDLKLDVARAYISILRAYRTSGVARSNVASLAAQARDVENLLGQGRGIRNDLLAARTALANARQRELQQRNSLDRAWSTYNRYLGRPLNAIVPIEDLPEPPAPDLPDASARTTPDVAAAEPVIDEGRIQPLIGFALGHRSELSQLTEQAHSQRSQGEAQRASTRPQATFYAANLYQNARFLPSQTDSGTAAFLVSWTLFDGGKSRRKAASYDHRALSYTSQRADLAAEIALQVRTNYLNVQEARNRVPVTREALEGAEENLRVARSRYLSQRGTNTEVLDAEFSRIQSYDNYYTALYDAALSDFELHRALGDL
jgi:outer membrane protein